MGRVSRNSLLSNKNDKIHVAPRMGRVSRNELSMARTERLNVAPRMGRVSRNIHSKVGSQVSISRAPHGACE